MSASAGPASQSTGSTGMGPSREEDGKVKGNEQANVHSLSGHKQNQAILGFELPVMLG